MELDSKIPPGPLARSGTYAKSHYKLVNPANKRKYDIIVVGAGLAGAVGRGDARRARLQRQVLRLPRLAAPRALHRRAGRHQRREELPERRRLHLPPLLRHRSKAATTARAKPTSIASPSCRVEHHRPGRRAGRAVRARVRRPAREPLLRRRAGLAHLLRARPDRPAAAPRRVPGAGAPDRARPREDVQRATRCSTSSSSTARPRASSPATWSPGRSSRTPADAVVLGTGGYANVFYLSTNAKASNATAIWRAHRRGAYFANPCYTQIHPTCIPQTGDYQSKLTLMSESLRNDGRIWVPKTQGDKRPPRQIPEAERDYYLERKYPSFGNLAPRDIASRAAKEVCDEGRGVGPAAAASISISPTPSSASARKVDRRALRQSLRDVPRHHRRGSVRGRRCASIPAPHYTMGGLWVDYNLMSTIPGLYVDRRGELLRPRREPPRRQRADAGSGRRLLRPAVHDRRLPRHASSARRSPPTVRSSSRREADVERAHRPAARRRRESAASTPSTASSARSCGTTAAWPAPPRG